MSDYRGASSGGINTSGALLIVFIVLKLCHVIDWSWWWVLSPIWISVGLLAFVLAGMFFWFSFRKKPGYPPRSRSGLDNIQ